MQAVIEKRTTYDLSRFDRTAKSAEKEAVAKKTKTRAKAARKTSISAFSVFSALVVFIMLTALLFSYVSLTEASDKNRKSSVELSELREEIQMLEISRNQRMGALQVRDWAVTKLGMSKIDKSQITYVTTSGGDRFEYGAEEKREAPKLVTGLIKGFSTIVEFIN